MRDAQRQKVYDAEANASYVLNRDGIIERRSVTLEEAQRIIEKLGAEFGTSPVDVSRNNRLQQWSGWYNGAAKTIEFARGAIAENTVLHEYAHHLAAEVSTTRYRGHGGQFVEAMIEVVRFWHGSSAAEIYQSRYDAQGCALTQHAEQETVDRAAERARRLRLRSGEYGDVWIVALEVIGGRRAFVVESTQTRNRYEYSLTQDHVFCWRSQKTAEKHAAKWRGFRSVVEAVAIQVPGVFTEPYSFYHASVSPRWHPRARVVTDEQVEDLIRSVKDAQFAERNKT